MTLHKPQNPPRIAALGYYGFGNLGDEAVLSGIRCALAEAIPDVDLRVLSADPAGTQRLHPAVRTTARWSWKDVAADLRGTDLFILGGGSLLQDATSVQSVLWYALMALIARRRARRVLWWGQGIGPLRSPLARRIVRTIARQADALTVRDEDSAQLLKDIGVRGSIQIVADPAFVLNPIPPTPNETDIAQIVFAPRAWKNDAFGAAWRTAEADHGWREARCAALPMHLPGDADYIRSLTNSASLPMWDWRARDWMPEQALGRIGQAELVVAMRLHALIFAVRCGVPFVALSYDPKVDALAIAAGQRDVLLPIAELDGARLRDAVAHARETAPARRAALGAFAEEQRARARVPALIARTLIDS